MEGVAIGLAREPRRLELSSSNGWRPKLWVATIGSVRSSECRTIGEDGFGRGQSLVRSGD